MAVARAFAIKQYRRDVYTSIEFVAYFHVHIEEWKGRDDVVLEEKATFTLCLQGKTLGNAEWSVACTLLQGEKCMRCGNSNRFLEVP